MSIILKGGSSSDLADVNSDKALKVAPTTDPTKAGYVIAINPDGEAPEFGDDGRTRTGQEHLLIYDGFEGAALDARMWNATGSTMTMAASSNYWLLNSGSSIAASTYCNIISTRLINNF